MAGSGLVAAESGPKGAINLAIIPLLAAGLVGVYTAPVLLGGFVEELDLTPALAGLLVSAELIAMGCGALACPLLMRVFGGTGALLAGGCVAIAGQAGWLSMPSPTMLILLRILAGAGSGLCYGVACSQAARSRNPAVAFGFGMTLANILLALLLAVFPPFVQRHGLAGGLLLLAGLIAAMVVIAAPMLHGRGQAASPKGEKFRFRATLSPSFLTCLLAIFTTHLGLSVIWAFAERVGMEKGFGAAPIGAVLAMSTIANIVGAMLSTVLAAHLRPLKPVIAGTLAAALAALLIPTEDSWALFALALLLYGATYLFILPFQIALAASWGHPEEQGALAGGTGQLGYGLGPYVGGIIAGQSSYEFAAWFSLGCCLLAVAIYLAMHSSGSIPGGYSEKH